MRSLALAVLVAVVAVAIWLLASEDSEPLLTPVAGAAQAEESAPEVAETESLEGHQVIADAPQDPAQREGGETVGEKESAAASLSVSILDASDQSALGGLELHVRPTDGEDFSWESQQRVGLKGKVQIEVEAGRELAVRVGGEALTRWTPDGTEYDAIYPYQERIVTLPPLEPGELRECVVELERGELSNWFRVFDAASGEPVADAVLVGGLHTDASSDWQGYFGLRAHDNWIGGQGLLFWHAQYGIGVANLGDGGPSKDAAYRVELLPPASLAVTLTRDGVPVAGAEVCVDLRSYDGKPAALTPSGRFNRTSPVPFWAETDARGRVVLEGLPVGEALLLFLANAGRSKVERACPERIVLQSGEQRELQWDLGGEQEIRGQAWLADGQPAAKERIWLLSGTYFEQVEVDQVEIDWQARDYVIDEVSADEGGGFVIQEVVPGRYWVALAPRGSNEEITGVAQRLEVTAQQAPPFVELRRNPGTRLRGLLTDTEGTPLAGISMFAMGEKGRRPDEFSSGPDGRFEIGPFVEGEKVHFITMGFGEGGWSLAGEGTAIAGQPGEITLVLTRGGSISGRVEVPEGLSNEGIYVQVLSSDGKGAMGTGTGQGGTFSWDGLAPGNWRVVVLESGGWVGASPTLLVEAGGSIEDVVVRVQRGGEIVVWNNAAQAAPFQVLVDELPVTFDVLQPGERKTLSVPAGEVRVEVNAWSDELKAVSWSEAKTRVSVGATATIPLVDEGSR